MLSTNIGNGDLAARHMAMPKLMGAPAYARPKRPVEVERPFDPDDLPVEAERTDEDRHLAAAVADGQGSAADAREHVLGPSDITGLRQIASRLIRRRG